MELIKRDDRFDLYNEDGHKIASTLKGCVNKLSLKNCQEIENGYDLYDLAKTSMNKINILFNHSLDSKSHTIGFRAGWQHALKFFGNKKYSEDDIRKAILLSMKYNDNAVIKLLQQTQYDCEIVMEGFVDDEGVYCGEKPELDKDGCLILKRKI